MFDNKRKMEQLSDFRPTSKMQIRQFCMRFAEGDVKKATEMYEFYANGIDLPDLEPEPVSKMQAFKNGAADVMGFVRDNQDDLINAIAFVKSLFGRGSVAQAAEPLTNIN